MLVRFLQNVSKPAPVWANVSGSFPVLRDVVYNDVLNLWCIVGEAKTILTSPDGAAWTSRTAGTGLEALMFRVAVGDGGVFVATRDSNVVDVSSDGTTWTRKSLGQVTAPDQAVGLAYSPTLDRWLAIGSANAEQSYTSDATTSPWTNTFGNAKASQVLWDSVNGYYVLASRLNKIVVTSTDGITNFDDCTSPGTKGASDNADAIAWDGASTYIVALGGPFGTSTSNVWRNTSGDPLNGTWQDVTHPFGAHKITSIAYSPTLDVWRACSAGGQIGVSADGGATWTLETLPVSPLNLYGINWSEELQQFVAVGQLGSGPNTGVILVNA